MAAVFQQDCPRPLRPPSGQRRTPGGGPRGAPPSHAGARPVGRQVARHTGVSSNINSCLSSRKAAAPGCCRARPGRQAGPCTTAPLPRLTLRAANSSARRAWICCATASRSPSILASRAFSCRAAGGRSTEEGESTARKVRLWGRQATPASPAQEAAVRMGPATRHPVAACCSCCHTPGGRAPRRRGARP